MPTLRGPNSQGQRQQNVGVEGLRATSQTGHHMQRQAIEDARLEEGAQPLGDRGLG